jgi:hypothetical protein
LWCLAEIEGGRADEVADVLDQEQRLVGGCRRCMAWPTMWPSRWQPLPVLICSAGTPVARMRSASLEVCWSPSTTLMATLSLSSSMVLHQQRGLAGTGAGNEVQREDAALVEPLAVGRGVGVVLGQDVLLDLHHARLAHARHVGAGRAGAVIEIAGDAVFVMAMLFAMRVGAARLRAVGVAVLAAIAVVMGMRMHAERRVVVAVIVLMAWSWAWVCTVPSSWTWVCSCAPPSIFVSPAPQPQTVHIVVS